MNVANHQEERNEKTKRGKRQAEEERQMTILKKLRAALLRSFRGQHGEKMVCARGVPGVSGILGKEQPFRPNPNGVGDRTTTLRRLLIGARLFLFVRLIVQAARSNLAQKAPRS